jgi:hypothetical protein
MLYPFTVAVFSRSLSISVLAALLLHAPEVLAQRGRRGSGNAAAGPRVPLPMQGVILTIHGKLKELKKKQLTVDGDDQKVWILRRTSKTKFYRGDKEVKPFEIELETLVSVDMSEGNDLKFQALAVKAEPKEKKVLIER